MLNLQMGLRLRDHGGAEVKVWRLRAGNALPDENEEMPTCRYCRNELSRNRPWQDFCDNHGKCRNAYHKGKNK